MEEVGLVQIAGEEENIPRQRGGHPDQEKGGMKAEVWELQSSAYGKREDFDLASLDIIREFCFVEINQKEIAPALPFSPPLNCGLHERDPKKT